MSFIRVRHIIGAPGKKHKYASQGYVINTETNQLTLHPPQTISLASTNVRMREVDCPKWEIQQDGYGVGYLLLTAERLKAINNDILSQLIETNGGLYGKQENQ